MVFVSVIGSTDPFNENARIPTGIRATKNPNNDSQMDVGCYRVKIKENGKRSLVVLLWFDRNEESKQQKKHDLQGDIVLSLLTSQTIRDERMAVERYVAAGAPQSLLLEAGSGDRACLASCEGRILPAEPLSFPASVEDPGVIEDSQPCGVHPEECGPTFVATRQEEDDPACVATSESLSFPERERVHMRGNMPGERPSDAPMSSCEAGQLALPESVGVTNIARETGRFVHTIPIVLIHVYPDQWTERLQR